MRLKFLVKKATANSFLLNAKVLKTLVWNKKNQLTIVGYRQHSSEANKKVKSHKVFFHRKSCAHYIQICLEQIFVFPQSGPITLKKA